VTKQKEPRSCAFVGLTRPADGEAKPMICQFCHQDVKNPVTMFRRCGNEP
jgi:hypothetical protein